jgi:hypothetical protein
MKPYAIAGGLGLSGLGANWIFGSSKKDQAGGNSVEPGKVTEDDTSKARGSSRHGKVEGKGDSLVSDLAASGAGGILGYLVAGQDRPSDTAEEREANSQRRALMALAGAGTGFGINTLVNKA